MDKDNATTPTANGDTPNGWESCDHLFFRRDEFKKVVVLVHGTFAASFSDRGNSWWQKQGALHSDLLDPSTFVIAFHWSGENSEESRRAAGRRLWVLLMQIEDCGKPYVVVAHSHGGNVALHALVTDIIWADGGWLRPPRARSELEEWSDLPTEGMPITFLPVPGQGFIGLSHMRAWITIGTPFLSHSTRITLFELAAWSALFLVCILPAGALFLILAERLYEREFIGAIGASLGAAMYVLISVNFGKDLLRMSLGRRSVRKYLPLTLNTYSDKHIGFWSRHDEAIQALRAVLVPPTAPIVPRFDSFGFQRKGSASRNDTSHWSDADSFLKKARKPGFGLALVQSILKLGVDCSRKATGALMNVIVLKPIDWLLHHRIKRQVLGDNLSFAWCENVSTSPTGSYDESTCIEETLKSDLYEHVRKRDHHVTAVFRSLIYAGAQSGIATIRKVDADRLSQFLVHNSYFDHRPTYQCILSEIRQRLDNAENDELQESKGGAETIDK